MVETGKELGGHRHYFEFSKEKKNGAKQPVVNY